MMTKAQSIRIGKARKLSTGGEVQFTPGPWHTTYSDAHESTLICTWGVNGPTAIVARIHPTTYDVGKVGLSETDSANARLIAAAPDLLAIVEEFVREATEMNRDDQTAQQARAILAKVNGGSREQ